MARTSTLTAPTGQHVGTTLVPAAAEDVARAIVALARDWTIVATAVTPIGNSGLFGTGSSTTNRLVTVITSASK